MSAIAIVIVFFLSCLCCFILGVISSHMMLSDLASAVSKVESEVKKVEEATLKISLLK